MPHVIRRSDGPSRKVVDRRRRRRAGWRRRGSPASAATTSSLLEAAAEAGGQLRLAAAQAAAQGAASASSTGGVERCSPARRRDALQHLGRGGRCAGAGARRGDRRDRRPARTRDCSRRATTCRSRAGTSSRRRQAAEDVLLYDDNGAHPGMSAAEVIADAGCAARDRLAGALLRARGRRPEPCALLPRVPARPARASPSISRLYARCGARATSWSRDHRLGLWPALTERAAGRPGRRRARHAAARRALSRAEAGLEQWRRGRLRGADRAAGRRRRRAIPTGGYRLFRIGDAVASRNIHAAIYDALRLCKDL